MTSEDKKMVDELDNLPANKIKEAFEEKFAVEGEAFLMEVDFEEVYTMQFTGETIWYLLKALELLSVEQETDYINQKLEKKNDT